jgi:hypothetical protein
VLADPRYQRELPPHGEKGSTPPGLTGGGGPILLPALGAAAPLAKLVLYALLAAAALLLVLGLSQAVARRRRRLRGRPDPASAETPEESRKKAPADALLADASRLAAQGLYGEAIHVLLLASIRHLAERSRVSLPESRTSREVARLLPLGPEARPAFDELVRAVERSLFGGLPAGPGDYERNLARFRQLTGRAA